MAEEFIKRDEFERFKEETNSKIKELSSDIKNFSNVLSQIDKKIDIMLNNMENTTNTEGLRLEKFLAPIANKQSVQEQKIQENTEEIDEIKENNKWLWRTIAGTIIAALAEIIVAAIAFFHK